MWNKSYNSQDTFNKKIYNCNVNIQLLYHSVLYHFLFFRKKWHKIECFIYTKLTWHNIRFYITFWLNIYWDKCIWQNIVLFSVLWHFVQLDFSISFWKYVFFLNIYLFSKYSVLWHFLFYATLFDKKYIRLFLCVFEKPKNAPQHYKTSKFPLWIFPIKISQKLSI